MGLYNRLVVSLKCKNCQNSFEGRIQFKVGDVDLNNYHVGDDIKITIADLDLKEKKIMAYGVLENGQCPFCNFNNAEEYDVLIDQRKVLGWRIMLDNSPYLEATFNGGRFYFP